jgi:quinol monooxygenase YgiN
MAAPTVRMTVDWVVPLGESRALASVLHQMMVAARAHPGCVGCSVSTNAGRQVGVHYEEEWVDEDLLRREVRSDRFSTLAALMESTTTMPAVEFFVGGGRRGLDYVAEVRASPGR